MRSVHWEPITTIYDIDISDIEKLRGVDNKFHYFYKIINNVTGGYYYGIHTTTDLDDGYRGSGSLLHTVYKKYGVKNFEKHILQFFDDRKSVLNYEKEVVTQELVKSKECYNLTIGGVGIPDYVHPEHYTLHTTKGRIHINNGKVTKLIAPQDLQSYVNCNWKVGQICKSNIGKIVVHKEGNGDKFIYPEELQQYLDQGWSQHGVTRNKGQTSHAKNKIWINNSEICKRVSQEELQQYLDQGWKRGSIQETNKGRTIITDGQVNKFIRNTDTDLLNYYLSNGWRIGSHIDRATHCWVSLGNDAKRIKKEELQQYLDQGWKRGNVKISKYNWTNKHLHINRVAIYNEDLKVKVKYIKKEELQQYLDRGWKRGIIRINKESKSKGKIRIHKGEATMTILPEDLQKYLNLGWERGNIHKVVMKGRVRVTNGLEERLITKEEFENYDKTVWRRGLLKNRRQITKTLTI